MKNMKLETLHVEYLSAMAEATGGHQVLKSLIEVYLERAELLLMHISTAIAREDREGLLRSLKYLRAGSEKIGAAKLPAIINRPHHGYRNARRRAQRRMP